MNESLQIYIDSKQAIRYLNGTSHCVFDIPQITVDSQYEFIISVVNASIPYTFYNINMYNNQIQWIEDPYMSFVVHSVVIPTGNYNINDLVSTLNTLLAPIVVTYSTISNRMTFTHPTTNWAFYANGSNTAFELLGLTAVNHFSSLRVINSDIVCNLFTVRTICICSNFRTSNIHLTRTHMNSVLTNIPVNTYPGGLILYENPNGFRNNLMTNFIGEIEISLIDENGNPIDLNGANYSMTLQLDIHKFVDE